MVSYNPSDLVAELSIDNSGKPVEVSIIVSTGSNSIDRSLVSSLYRWRASGNRINALKNRDTVKITIHLLFSR
jgi:TonB family protein